LPSAVTGLVGREADVERVTGLLSSTRLVTLVGTGGVGKTRLALHVATGTAGNYADGAWLVELAALSEPALVPQAVARVLGVVDQPGHAIQEALTALLRSRHSLLLLDNCEHLIGACAELVRALLSECPRVTVLATSREPLRVPGEMTWRVSSLAVPDPSVSLPLDELQDYGAIRLFVERATAVRSDFALTTRTSQAIAQICTQLGGIPLAIELAAARVRVLPVAQLLVRLRDGFGLLSGGSRAAPTRQQTLHATLEWSFDLLSQSERALFRRLAVFAGGFALEGAEAVCSGGEVAQRDVVELLTNLIDKSLVVLEHEQEAARYTLLEPIRRFGLERLFGSGEAEALQRGHAAYYLALAEHAAAQLRGPGQAGWLDRLELEHENLRAVLRRAVESGDAETALRLASALWFFWRVRGHLSEGQHWLETALAQPGGSTGARARAFLGAGFLALFRSDYDQAAAAADSSLAIHIELDETEGIAYSLHLRSAVALARGEYEAARALSEQALPLFRSLGDRWGAAYALVSLGSTLWRLGEHANALSLFEEAVTTLRELGDRWSASRVSVFLGALVYTHGDHERAVVLVTNSLAVLHEQDSRRELLEGMRVLAALAAGSQPERAGRLFGAAEAMSEAAGMIGPSPVSPGYTQAMAMARASLGEAPFAQAWSDGRAMSIEQAVSYAVAAEARTSPPGAHPGSLLTRREREVAALIARGSTNREIAAQLVIAEGTAERHVGNVLSKLGLRSRAHVAAWAVEHGLVSTAVA
jgi:non-specific serine/threonine protein kinase